jgi:hypothetical protein
VAQSVGPEFKSQNQKKKKLQESRQCGVDEIKNRKISGRRREPRNISTSV